MDWVRGQTVGHGSFGKVSMATARNGGVGFSPAMVVKSCSASRAASLLNEKRILDELQGCPEIVRCFGDSYSFEKGEKIYNVLLEFASRGSLGDKIKDSGDYRLPEFETRRYTKALLRGLRFIHETGYVHCDVKLDNILLGEDGRIRIADFGLAKRYGGGGESLGCELRGTPMYMSPEMVASGEQGPAADIWALGCVVAEMATGAPAWNCSNVAALLMRIGVGEEVPEIPGELSSEGQDFLGKCFLKDPRKRWTAEMLLNHPFVAAATVTLKDKSPVPFTSPRCPFDFPDWTSETESRQSSVTCSITSLPESEYSRPSSPATRLRGLFSDHSPNWSEVADGWVSIR
ncbi:PREDICTED: mitogen-activated protein kinase kinase kinase NPK1-like isoform X3 [Ipomoea nil]|uniref:mitogen-activated protein kinase kinase kinase NPK1-like isoform X3 n=1 Tax=Ipomoea nil TaxID=35883 RepID=UPI000901B00E|nr:PREDICTED: mitogen-activated protein kinase kinase kinase NPK1-like isoform X3 [Ipomoea nil]